jgi:tetratricopeptide (TPR) repeat protein
MVAGVALVALAAGSSVAPVLAADKPAKQAEEQVNRGYRAARRGYWQEALFRFERANALTPNEPRILNNIAVALEASGRFEEALVAYQSALAIAPNDRVLRQNYSRFREFYDAQVAPPKPAEDTPAKPAEDQAAPPGDAAPAPGGKESDDA